MSSIVAPYVPLGTPRRVEYYPTMRFIDGKECAPEDFEELSSEGFYESIPDDVPVKSYFDANHKFSELDDFSLDAAANVLRLHKLNIAAYMREKTGVEPIFAATDAHCDRKTDDKGVEYSKYSFHINTPNILMYKEAMKQMIPELNERIAKDQARGHSEITGADKYAEYIDSPGPIFDVNPYHKNNQMVRGTNASKPGEKRLFKLVEGSFNDNIITACFAPDAIVYSPPTPVFVPRELAAPISDTERDTNKTIVKMCFENGMFVEAARDYKSWSDMGLFFKGDTADAYELFDEFSKFAGPGHYTPDRNRDVWDKFGTDSEKYGNFGIFVNRAKKDNMSKYKEINAVMTDLKRTAKADARTAKADAKSDARTAKADAKADKYDRERREEEANAALFLEMSAEFELTHTKIVDKSVFIKEAANGELIVMTKQDMRVSYEYMQCGTNKHGTPLLFIDKWLTGNDNIKRKNTMEIYPCPNDVYNLWRPFAMELKTGEYTPHTGLARVLKHIEILSGNEKPVYDYFIGWIAKMIQYPAIKTTCITLISGEGAGRAH